MLDRKSFHSGIELKADGEEGAFRATFARLNVIDRDGDVTVPGAFTDGQSVRIASWGHKWHELPVGVGVIHADQETAWVDGQFFLDTTGGLDTYRTVKRLGPLQEWSYGFDILDSANGQFTGQQVRFLRKMDVFEVSPVLLGAGIGTRTDAIKSPFSDHVSRVLEDVVALTDRARDIASLRAKEGRTLSAANRQKLQALLDALNGLDPLRTEIAELLAATDPPEKALSVDALYADFLATQAALLGVPVPVRS